MVDFIIRQLLDWLLAGATELARKGKGKGKVVSSFIASLTKPSLKLQAEVMEGLIEGARNDKRLLSK